MPSNSFNVRLLRLQIFTTRLCSSCARPVCVNFTWFCATKRQPSINCFYDRIIQLTPSIQIDLVPSRTPTPEEQDNSLWIEQQQACKQKRKIRVKIIEEEDEDQLAEEEKVTKEEAKKRDAKKADSSECTTVQKANESKGSTRKKTSVSWTDSKEGDEDRAQQQARTQFNEDSLNNNISKLKDKNEQKVANNQISSKSAIKFDSPNETANHRVDRAPGQNNISSNQRRSSKTARFNQDSADRSDSISSAINWPNYDDHELNKVASRFVQQIIEDATREVEKRMKPSTSRTSGNSVSLNLFVCQRQQLSLLVCSLVNRLAEHLFDAFRLEISLFVRFVSGEFR